MQVDWRREGGRDEIDKRLWTIGVGVGVGVGVAGRQVRAQATPVLCAWGVGGSYP